MLLSWRRMGTLYEIYLGSCGETSRLICLKCGTFIEDNKSMYIT